MLKYKISNLISQLWLNSKYMLKCMVSVLRTIIILNISYKSIQQKKYKFLFKNLNVTFINLFKSL